jgi:hypothetical protein
MAPENLNRYNYTMPSVTRQLRWRMEASGWAASAAYSHHPTARVGHPRGSFVKTGPFSSQATDMTGQDVRRTWEVL